MDQAIGVATSRVLQLPTIGRLESIADFRRFDMGRATVAIAAVYNRQKLLVVESAKGTDVSSWGLPQGEMEPRDVTPEGTAYREGFEEVGFRPDCCFGFGIMLGEYLNPMPPERKLGFDYKHVFVLGYPVRSIDWVKLNKENKRFTWLGSADSLWQLISPRIKTRAVKCQAMIDTVNRLHEMKMLSWSCAGLTVH